MEFKNEKRTSQHCKHKRSTWRQRLLRIAFTYTVAVVASLLLLSGPGAWLDYQELDNRNVDISSSKLDTGNEDMLANSDPTPEEWRRWLTEHVVWITFDERPKPSPHPIRGGGCAISIQIQLLFRTGSGGPSSATKAFFKAAHVDDMSHIFAESHLREIKASYLDRILRTRVVPPCVGYRLGRRQVLAEDEGWAAVRRNLACAKKERKGQETSEGKRLVTGAQAPGDDRGRETTREEEEEEEEHFEGSLMFWKHGLQQVNKTQIFGSARLLDWRDDSAGGRGEGRPPEHRLGELASAVNNAIFIYLAGCMKTEHNYFGYRELPGSQSRNETSSSGIRDLGPRYLEIDNDRCMTPEASIDGAEDPEAHRNRFQVWEDLVFETVCRVPQSRLPVLRVVRDAAAGTQSPPASAAMVGAGDRRVSRRLRRALEDDALSDELLGSESEAFIEIDRRVDKLGAHVRKNCPLSPEETAARDHPTSEPGWNWRRSWKAAGRKNAPDLS